MSNSVLVIGSPGTGKSTSIRTLDPTETFIINVLNKPLPFKNYRKNYQLQTKDNEGNYFSSDKWNNIIKVIDYIDTKRPSIKNLVIDDFQYVMANEFMNRASEKGFDKFSELGLHTWMIINRINLVRDDLVVFVLSHNEVDEFGLSKIKTIGKLLDDKIALDGMFTVVLHTSVSNGEYKFLTANTGNMTAKAPIDMFEDSLIDNNLQFVKEKINNYYED